MKKWHVVIRETHVFQFIEEAENEEEARDMADARHAEDADEYFSHVANREIVVHEQKV